MLQLLIVAAVASTPTPPSGGTNQVISINYSGQAAMATALVGSADSTLFLSSWRLTDGTLCGALALAASRHVAVQVAYGVTPTGGTSDPGYIATKGIRASGGTVYACSFVHVMANNLVAADGDYTILGTYYYRPEAVQIGSYSTAVSGTGSAAEAKTQFLQNISGGTVTAFFMKNGCEQQLAMDPRQLAMDPRQLDQAVTMAESPGGNEPTCDTCQPGATLANEVPQCPCPDRPRRAQRVECPQTSSTTTCRPNRTHGITCLRSRESSRLSKRWSMRRQLNSPDLSTTLPGPCSQIRQSPLVLSPPPSRPRRIRERSCRIGVRRYRTRETFFYKSAESQASCQIWTTP